MKQTLLNCLLALSISVLPSYLIADTVTILSDEWYPINGQPNSSQPGYMIEIAQSILEAHGHQLDYRLAPWKRSILEVRKGNADCIIGAYKSDAPDFIFPDQAWGKARFNFYTRQDSSWYYSGLDHLQASRLGVISGYSYSPGLDNYIANQSTRDSIQIVAGENALEKNIRKLLAKRLDAIISFEPVFLKKLEELNLKNEIKYAGTLEQVEGLYLACSPNKKSSQNFIELFSQGFADLQRTGKLEQIKQRYGIKD